MSSPSMHTSLASRHPGLAPASLLLAASVWGLVWYPFRLLESAGLAGGVASLLTYGLGLLPLLYLARGRLWPGRAEAGWLLAVALSAGWTNLSYVLAVIHGEVMRVMLLFYLAPLWTIPFARLILGERAGRSGLAVIGLALAGALTMLHTGNGWPLPANTAEWLGLSSGMTFALANVLIRKTRAVPMETRSLWIFAGVAGIALLFPDTRATAAEAVGALDAGSWLLVAGVIVALLIATFSVQYGLVHVPANRAVVILLSELVVAALASHALAGEVMGFREWIGGAMIVAATLFSLRLIRHE